MQFTGSIFKTRRIHCSWKYYINNQLLRSISSILVIQDIARSNGNKLEKKI